LQYINKTAETKVGGVGIEQR